MSSSLLDVEGLKCRRGTFQLGPVTFGLNAGITYLVGENGAGKSTLMQALCGRLKSEGGKVRLLGRQSGEVGFLPQAFEFPPRVRVEDFLYYQAWLQGMPERQAKERIVRVLADADLAHRRKDIIGKLSGGMVRRLGIAVVRLNSAGVIIMDEPTVGLDPAQRQKFHSALRTSAENESSLISSHLIEDAVNYASRVLVLSRGKLVSDCALSPAISGSPDQKQRLVDDIVRLMKGSE